jgi:hypothetical protein
MAADMGRMARDCVVVFPVGAEVAFVAAGTPVVYFIKLGCFGQSVAALRPLFYT